MHNDVCAVPFQSIRPTGRAFQVVTVLCLRVPRPSAVINTEQCLSAFALRSLRAHRLRVGSALCLLFSPFMPRSGDVNCTEQYGATFAPYSSGAHRLQFGSALILLRCSFRALQIVNVSCLRVPRPSDLNDAGKCKTAFALYSSRAHGLPRQRVPRPSDVSDTEPYLTATFALYGSGARRLRCSPSANCVAAAWAK
eukprot:3491421-Pleurochrysis_carterae.AAC.2